MHLRCLGFSLTIWTVTRRSMKIEVSDVSMHTQHKLVLLRLCNFLTVIMSMDVYGTLGWLRIEYRFSKF